MDNRGPKLLSKEERDTIALIKVTDLYCVLATSN